MKELSSKIFGKVSEKNTCFFFHSTQEKPRGKLTVTSVKIMSSRNSYCLVF